MNYCCFIWVSNDVLWHYFTCVYVRSMNLCIFNFEEDFLSLHLISLNEVSSL